MDALELRTARLVLREPAPDENVAHAGYFDRNADRLRLSGPLGPSQRDPAWWATRFVERRAARLAGFSVHFGVYTADGGALAGLVNFTDVARGPLQSCNLGFTCDAAFEGKGIMFEAISAAIPAVFSAVGLHRIQAGHRPENLRSARLLQRLGFEREGYARAYLFLDGRWHDHVLTSRINPDWKPIVAPST